MMRGLVLIVATCVYLFLVIVIGEVMSRCFFLKLMII